MKKFYLICCLFATALVSTAQPFTSVWTKLATGVAPYTWFLADNNTTSLDYNPVTDKLLVAKRNTAVYIINPATGDIEGTLSTTGITVGSFTFNKIRVTADGVIYAITLATAAGNCTITRWANQAANPTTFTFAVTERTGDAFGLSGTGNSTILYASGAASAGGVVGNVNIYMLNTVNGLNFFLESKIVVPTGSTGITQWANRAVEPVSNSLTSDLWINSGGGQARRITVGAKSGDTRPGAFAFAVEDGVGNGQASVGYGGLRLISVATTSSKYLVFAGGNNSNAGTRMKTLNVTNEAAVTTYGLDSLYQPDVVASYITNANGTGDAAYKKETNGTYTVFYLSTNNGIQATRTGDAILPISLSQFSAVLQNRSVILDWNTASEANNSGFNIEKSINGKDFSNIGFMRTKATNGNSNSVLTYQFEDTKLVEGKSYYRLQQVDRDSRAVYSDIKTVQAALTQAFTIRLLQNPMRDNLLLNVKSKGAKKIQITLTNSGGAVVISTQKNIVSGDNNITLPASALANGVYYLSVKDNETGKQEAVLKVVKD